MNVVQGFGSVGRSISLLLTCDLQQEEHMKYMGPSDFEFTALENLQDLFIMAHSPDSRIWLEALVIVICVSGWSRLSSTGNQA